MLGAARVRARRVPELLDLLPQHSHRLLQLHIRPKRLVQHPLHRIGHLALSPARVLPQEEPKPRQRPRGQPIGRRLAAQALRSVVQHVHLRQEGG